MNIAISILQACLAILGASFVMAGWSENYFFNEGPAETLLNAIATKPINALLSQIEIALFYAIPASAAIAAVAWRGITGLGPAMLIAALVGFSIEGALVPAVYEAVPLSYLWTSVAWHGPVTVGLGLFLMPRLLGRLSAPAMASVAVATGVFWGLWTTWVWDGSIPNLSTVDFAVYVGWTFGGIAMGYVMLHLAGWPRVCLKRPVIWLFALLNAAFFTMQAILFPIGGAGLALILAALLYALGRWEPVSANPEPMKWINFAVLSLMPIVAVAIYAIQVALGPLLPQEELISLTALSGLLVWMGCLIAGYRLHRRNVAA